jgi:two-component system OmpR family response regulator
MFNCGRLRIAEPIIGQTYGLSPDCQVLFGMFKEVLGSLRCSLSGLIIEHMKGHNIRAPAAPHVLLVDDDIELMGLIADYLREDGFIVSEARDASHAREVLASTQFDIAVLDVMMPGQSGIDLLRCLKAESTMPILMLTARGDEVDRIVGLELGADDYVPKPCSPRELAARLRAVLRRGSSLAEVGAIEPPLQVGPLLLTPENRAAYWNKHPLHFTGAEFNVLEVLMRKAGRLVRKDEISERALGRPLARFDRGIDVHISSIRQKLSTHACGKEIIRTVRGMGYQLLRESD